MEFKNIYHFFCIIYIYDPNRVLPFAVSKNKVSAATDRINTAVHVVQGAFARVLGSGVLLGANASII
jgi:hypothetical protein